MALSALVGLAAGAVVAMVANRKRGDSAQNLLLELDPALAQSVKTTMSELNDDEMTVATPEDVRAEASRLNGLLDNLEHLSAMARTGVRIILRQANSVLEHANAPAPDTDEPSD